MACDRIIDDLERENRKLGRNVRELESVAESWMKDYDKLKAKYEPSVVVLSASEVDCQASKGGESE